MRDRTAGSPAVVVHVEEEIDPEKPVAGLEHDRVGRDEVVDGLRPRPKYLGDMRHGRAGPSRGQKS